MSGDEVFVTVFAIVLGPIGWAWWLFRANAVDGLRRGRPPVAMLGGAVGVAGLLVFAVLRLWAADDVREAPPYLFMYFVLGLAWMRLAAIFFPLAGLNPRDDLIERRNAAAYPSWIGAIVGVALCYAGANIGNGPGWWVVVFSAALATTALAAVWLIAGRWGGLVELVTVGRDLAAGVRLGGLLTACGAIFGWAVAGDWIYAAATIEDFAARAWMAIPIVIVALMIERVAQPTPQRLRLPIVPAGAVPALLYLILAAVAIMWPVGKAM